MWPGILQQTIYVGRPVLGKPTTSRTQLGTHKELAEIRMGHEQETRPVTQGIETLWLATGSVRRGKGGEGMPSCNKTKKHFDDRRTAPFIPGSPVHSGGGYSLVQWELGGD